MTMTTCRECGKEISGESMSCVNCGASVPGRKISTDWIPCPKCGSAKTRRTGYGVWGWASFAMGGCLLWIPVIGWILAPFFLIFALALWITSILPSGNAIFNCQSCNETFKIPKSELPK